MAARVRPWPCGAVAVYVLASAASVADCSTSSSTAPLAVTPSLVTEPWRGPLPRGTPATCSGETYVVAATDAGASGPCQGGAIWLLCDGASYEEYTCEYPGPTWMQVTIVLDASASGGGSTSHSASSSSTAASASSTVHTDGGG